MMNFYGGQDRLTNTDIFSIAKMFKLDYADCKGLIEVETGTGKGFIADGRPVMLFEPHKFYENLSEPHRSEAVRQSLAYKKWGTRPYPKTVGGSYQRLAQAMLIDEEAALESCSWGMGQIMGSNYAELGYASVYEMVEANIRSEDEQFKDMCKLLVKWKIDDDLREERYTVVARTWNGPGYKKNRYDTKLRDAVRKWRKVGEPSTPSADGSLRKGDKGWKVRALQERLVALGYHLKPDGDFGNLTRDAVMAFQADNGLTTSGNVDRATMQKLDDAQVRPLSEQRTSAEVKDLKGESRIVDAGEDLKRGAVGLVALEGATEGTKQLPAPGELLGDYAALLEPLSTIRDFVGDHKTIIYIAVGLAVWFIATKVQKWRTEDHRTGKTV